MSAVCDASFLVASASLPGREPAGEAARTVIGAIQERFGLQAPSLVAWEVGHVFYRKVRNVNLTPDQRAELVELALDSVHLWVLDPEALRRTGRIAAKHDLSFYDASYLELAAREPENILLSEDRRLLQAARRLLGGKRAMDARTAAKRLSDEL